MALERRRLLAMLLRHGTYLGGICVRTCAGPRASSGQPVHSVELRLQVGLQALDRVGCVLVPDDRRGLHARLLGEVSEAVALLDRRRSPRSVAAR